MKNLLFVFFIVSGWCWSQNTYIPDDNFEQAIIDLGFDSGPLDDNVPTAMISSITFLNISQKNISDLTGIADFDELRNLDVSINNLSNLDLSNNSNLRIIRCYQNNLTNLILGTNTSLEQIWTYDNFLSSIDVSNLPNLLQLSIINNQLTSLDVTNNLQLTNLWCYTNSLTQLDISNNSELVRLWCASNQLTTIDVSQNMNLGVLICSQNQIDSLDLQNNGSLTYLVCNSNQLTSLNVRNGNNVNVTDFNAFNNPNLECIEVDDPVYSQTNWTNVPANASFNDDCMNLGINEFSNLEIEVYPNPASETISLRHNLGTIDAIEIYDIFGKVLRTTTLVTIDISNFKSGIYFLKIHSNSGILTTKVIKK